MRPRLATLQVQKQVLAPLMQQSITVLLLPLAELVATIEQELQTNPLLEIAESPETPTPTSSPNDDQIRQYLDRLTKYGNDESYNAFEDDFPEERSGLMKELTLEERLMRQLRIEFSDEADIKIGELIIGNLNEDGYLKIGVEEIAQLAGTDDLNRVEKVLSIVQNFEPIGIAARDIKECILIQLKAKNQFHPSLARIVNEHLEDIGKKRYADIARKFGMSINEVQKMAHLISTIEPKPARNYGPIDQNIYVKPDVSITYNEEQGYQIHIIEEGIPSLRINSSYKAMLNRPNLKEEEKIFIRERLESAMHFIKSIEQRGRTLREITKYILEHQKDFFAGNFLSIAPMTLKDVALAIGRNESTISRAINNKYAETPQGIYPLKFFFSQAMPTAENGNTSAQSIKEEIKDLVASENKSSPLSDNEIQRHFEGKGVHLARRTVTKYRESLFIPASYLRKEMKLN